MLLLSCANFAGNPKETTWESLSEVMEYKYQGPTARCCDGTYSYSQNHQELVLIIVVFVNGIDNIKNFMYE